MHSGHYYNLVFNAGNFYQVEDDKEAKLVEDFENDEYFFMYVRLSEVIMMDLPNIDILASKLTKENLTNLDQQLSANTFNFQLKEINDKINKSKYNKRKLQISKPILSNKKHKPTTLKKTTLLCEKADLLCQKKMLNKQVCNRKLVKGSCRYHKNDDESSEIY